MKPLHIMLDIETLGTLPGSVITQIGACEVLPPDGQPLQGFHIGLKAQPQIAAGMNLSDETLRFWHDQPGSPFLAEAIHPKPALEAFVKSIHRLQILRQTPNADDLRFWCYGATFDVPLLEVAFDAFGVRAPWGYRSVRCLRTFFAIFPRVKVDGEFGAKHDAFADVQQQSADLVATAKAAGVDLDAL